MRLQTLLNGVAIKDVRGTEKREISGIAYDSRDVEQGYLFVALRGHAKDGHDFIEEAVRKGASAVVGEQFAAVDPEVTWIRVQNSREALSKLAVSFYKAPFERMTLIGITGTNGKTTSSYLLESILSVAGRVPGVIGTVNYRVLGQTWDAAVTTPESLDLMRMLRRMADAGATDVVIEVSSHALDQGRAKDCPFEGAVFTNISRDHLDYHHSMAEYFDTKCSLFSSGLKGATNSLKWAAINTDDPKGKALLSLTDARAVTYGTEKGCDVRAEDVRVTRDGLCAGLITPAGQTRVESELIGHFNIYNILAASTAAFCMDIDLELVSEGIGRLKGVPGRLELVKNRRSLMIVVDYAHTPDALSKAIGAVKPLVNGKLITVFGCGGDRDKGKRWEMGRVAGGHSDVVIVTSDNPRTEDPAAIAAQAEKGVQESGLKRINGASHRDIGESGYFLDLDRASAIGKAVQLADERDVILIAGKGHEDYQIIGRERRHFDDREVAAKAASGAS
jgi:UDP-N-acetylmuramoyl-L-alanyl-D-glutamate--2,6-diaminopimelate ligase